jgi:hypothetical protein
MKKRVKNRLLLLLSVRAGICPDHVRKELQRGVSNDPLLASRWDQVNRAWDGDGYGANGIVPETAEIETTFSPATIASFVEGRLGEQAADRLSQSAWDSPTLLAEICDIFRSVHGQDAEAESNDSWDSVDEKRLSTRLIALFDSDQAVAPYSTHVMATPVIAANGADKSRGVAVTSKRSGGKLIWAVIAPVLAIAAAILVFARLSAPHEEPEDNGQATAAAGKMVDRPPGQEKNESVQDRELAENGKGSPNTEEPPESVTGEEMLPEDPVPNDQQVAREGNEGQRSEARDPWFAFDDEKPPAGVDDKDPDRMEPRTENDIASGDRDKNVEEAFTVVREDVRFELDEVKGVIGLFLESQGVWQGYASQSPVAPGDAASTVVFSGSWVRGKIPGAGEWVLDGDTEIRLTRETMMSRTEDPQAPGMSDAPVRPPQFSLEVLSGRVGIENLPEETDLAVRYMNREFSITASSDDAVVAFDAYGELPVLSVRRGKVELDGEVLPAGRSRFLGGQGWSEVLPTRHSLRWLDRPGDYVRIPDKLQTELLSADDLREQFRKMSRLEDVAARRTGGLWLMSVQPALIAESLRNPTAEDWNLLMDWLSVQHRRGHRQRAVWLALGEAIGDEQFARLLFQWNRMIDLQQKPTMEQADRFLAYLNHDTLFIRFAASSVLERSFANPSRYDPTLGPEQRMAAARGWRRHIMQFLGQ